MTAPIIKPVPGIGSNRAPCAHSVRVAAGLKTTASQIAASQRARKGIPVDQCGKRSDFLINGKPICRAHAGAIALAWLQANQPEGER